MIEFCLFLWAILVHQFCQNYLVGCQFCYRYSGLNSFKQAQFLQFIIFFLFKTIKARIPITRTNTLLSNSDRTNLPLLPIEINRTLSSPLSIYELILFEVSYCLSILLQTYKEVVNRQNQEVNMFVFISLQYLYHPSPHSLTYT